MHSTPRVALTVLLLFWTFAPALAQSEKQDVASSSTDVVTVAANAQGVRFTAPNRVVQLRLEVYSELGQKLFDTEQRGGNVLDWQVQNGSGERVADGTYLCVVTVKTLSGRLKQKLGLVTVSAKATAMRAAKPAELSSQQTEAVGPVAGNSELTVMPTGESLPATALLHSGDEGQLSRTAGALSFRLGDFFSGRDKEQMRLTEEGNLGVGTDKPKAKLDVAGTIRTSEGIEFANADGTKVTRLTTTATGGLQQTLADGTVVTNATGTGTQNNIAKWTDNAGSLGDSSIFENASRNVGIGTTTPGAKLHVVGTQGSVGAGSFQLDTPTLFSNWTGAYPALEMVNTNLTNNNISLFQFADAPTGAAHAGIGAVNTSHTNKYGDLFFFTKQSDGYQMRMGIFGGNVGIGTTTPRVRLEVNGNTLITPGNGYEIQFGAPNGETGLTLIQPGVSRADIRFNGSKLSLLAGTGVTPPAGGIVVETSGHVAIGTPEPNSVASLTVHSDSFHAVVATSSGGAGTQGIWGVSDNGTGVFGEGGIGVRGSSGFGTALVVRSQAGILVEGFSDPSGVRTFHINLNGTYVAGSDFAESLPARGHKAAYEPGDVLVMSTQAEGAVEKSRRPYDVRLAGVYSTRPAMLGAEKDGATRVDPNEVPVAIVGIVPTKVSAMNGRIRVGDLLTTSSMPGYAMRCTNRAKCVGAIIGKALEPLAGTKGVIKVLVMLR